MRADNYESPKRPKGNAIEVDGPFERFWIVRG